MNRPPWEGKPGAGIDSLRVADVVSAALKSDTKIGVITAIGVVQLDAAVWRVSVKAIRGSTNFSRRFTVDVSVVAQTMAPATRGAALGAILNVSKKSERKVV